MKKKIKDDVQLLNEMVKDQESSYKVDPFWENYAYPNITKIKHLNLKNFLQFTNSFGILSSKRYTFLGKFFLRVYFGILIKIKRNFKYDISFPNIFKILNYLNFTTNDYTLSKKNYNSFILKLINSQPNSSKILDLNDELIFEPKDTIKIIDKEYSFNFVWYFYDYLIADNFLDFSKSNYYLEIGGGYGGFTEIVKKINSNIKIIYIDIMPQLYVAEQYLKSIFPNKVAGYRETKKMKFINEQSFSKFDIVILPPWNISKIQDGLVNIFFNANSFQEMQKDTVNKYCNELGRIVNNKIALLEQREGNGSIVDPVTRKEYIDYMRSNKFDLINEKPATLKKHKYSRHQEFYFFQKKN